MLPCSVRSLEERECERQQRMLRVLADALYQLPEGELVVPDLTATQRQTPTLALMIGEVDVGWTPVATTAPVVQRSGGR
jgi:hypothetical protein